MPARADALVAENTTIGVDDKAAVAREVSPAKAPSAEAEADPRASLLRPVGGLTSVETLSSAGSTK